MGGRTCGVKDAIRMGGRNGRRKSMSRKCIFDVGWECGDILSDWVELHARLT